MKVLATYPWPEFWSMGEGRGAPSFFLSITSFPKHGHELHVLMPGPPGSPLEEDYHGVHLHRFHTTVDYMPEVGSSKLLQHIRLFTSYRHWFSHATPLARELADNLEPDAMFGMGALGAPVARIIAEERGVPNVTRLFGTSIGEVINHPIKFRLRYREIRAFQTPADYIILHNDGSGGDEIARRLGVDMDRFLFWSNGLDRAPYMKKPNAADVRRRVGVSDSGPVVLTVTRLHPEKHVERLLNAAPGVLAERGDVSFLVVGDGEERSALERLSVKLGLTPSVVFAGAIDKDELPSIYGIADIFVALSDRTNMGNPTDEAMMSGLAVVALDTGSTADIVRDGENGILLPADGLPRLPGVLLELLADDDGRRRLGEAARVDVDRWLPTVEERQAMEVEAVERAVSERMGERS
jgi:glycosyltransferase involved in cell wall biosynthesis